MLNLSCTRSHGLYMLLMIRGCRAGLEAIQRGRPVRLSLIKHSSLIKLIKHSHTCLNLSEWTAEPSIML